jgi:hypothetical protein
MLDDVSNKDGDDFRVWPEDWEFTIRKGASKADPSALT